MKPQCERCGEPSRVHILEGYHDGEPMGRSFCLRCADSAYEHYLIDHAVIGRARLGIGSVLIVGGALVTLLGLAVDHLGVQGHEGFGWMQQIALLGGALLLLIGALMRVDIIAVVGTILIGLGALADALGRFGAPGVGWRQRLVLGFGFLVVLIGLKLRSARRSTSASGPK